MGSDDPDNREVPFEDPVSIPEEVAAAAAETGTDELPGAAANNEEVEAVALSLTAETSGILDDVGSTTVELSLAMDVVDTAEEVALSLIAGMSADGATDGSPIVELLFAEVVTCELTKPVELNSALVEAAVSLSVEEPRTRLLIPVLEEDSVKEPELMVELCAELAEETPVEDKDGALDWMALEPAEDTTAEDDSGALEETELTDEDSGALEEIPELADEDNGALEAATELADEDNSALEAALELADEDNGALDPERAAKEDTCTLEDDTRGWDDETAAEDEAS